MSETPKIAYVTKYALSGGIGRYEIERVDPSGYAKVLMPESFSGWDTLGASHWHSTPEAALARAETMRVAKIASLKKQIAKLEKLEFSIPQAPSV